MNNKDMLDQQRLRTIKYQFGQMQQQFNIYNNMNYTQERRFKAYDIAQKHIEELKKFGLYYTIWDEDEQNSYIRPDCYIEEYNDALQAIVEKMLNIQYQTGEGDWNLLAFKAAVYHKGEKIETLVYLEKSRDVAYIENQIMQVYVFETRQSTPVSNDILSYTTDKNEAELYEKQHPHVEQDPWYYI